IHVTITVAPDSSSAFLSALASLLDQMEKERESTYFEVSQNPEQAGQFRLVENWACDKKRMIEISLRDHTCVQMKKEYYKPFLEMTEPLYIQPRKIEIFERLAPEAWTRSKETNFKA
ncbi:hypothetical protein K432DRAFT_306988, partial [Lepidopterella palustris CBS 459.81]